MSLLGFSVDINDAELIKKCQIIQLFVDDDKKYDLPYDEFPLTTIHSSYKFTINNNKIMYAISKEVKFLTKLKNPYGIIVHLNTYVKKRDDALIDLSKRIKYILKKYIVPHNLFLMLETSHNINHIGSTTYDLSMLYDKFNKKEKKYLFFCLDTSHIFLAGYPIFKEDELVKYFSIFNIFIGLDKIKLIHLNDINSPILGPHTPHLPIGKGVIFNDVNLNILLSFSNTYSIPIILERKINDYDELIYIKNKKFKNNFDEVIKKKTANIKKKYIAKVKDLVDYVPVITTNKNLKDIILVHKVLLDLLELPHIGKKKLKEIFNDEIKDNISLTNILNIKKKYENEYNHYSININDALMIKRYIDLNLSNEHYFLGSLHRYLDDEKQNINNILRPPRANYYIKDLDLLIIENNNNFELNFLNIIKTNYSGQKRKQFQCKYNNVNFILDIFFCSEKNKITFIFYLEGPYIKNIIYRKIAKKLGYLLNEYGLFKNKTMIEINNINQLYQILQTKKKIFH